MRLRAQEDAEEMDELSRELIKELERFNETYGG